MSKRIAFILLGTLLLATLPAFAQTETGAGAAQATPGGVKWGALAAGFTIAVAAFGGAISQGRAVAAACDAIGRNPGAAGNIRFITILGLALIESLVIYALIIAFSVR